MKKNIKIILLVLLIFCLTGCFESKEEKEKRKAYYEQAKENTIVYIQKKYGFTPELGTAKCTFDNSDNFSSSCKNLIMVNVKYNDKWFKVKISGSEVTEEGSDDYQFEEISRDIISLITNDFGTPYKYKIYYGEEDENIIDTYYDGNNLQEIIKNNYVNCLLEYIEHDSFKNLEAKKDLSKYSSFLHLYAINYKSLNDYKKSNDHDYNIRGTRLERMFSDNSEHLIDVFTLEFGNIRYYSYN